MGLPVNLLISQVTSNYETFSKKVSECFASEILPHITKFWWHMAIFECFVLFFFYRTAILIIFIMPHYFWLCPYFLMNNCSLINTHSTRSLLMRKTWWNHGKWGIGSKFREKSGKFVISHEAESNLENNKSIRK